MSGYPIVLVDLANTACVVIGGGQVAARKVAALCQAGGRPLVISPVLCESLRSQVEDGEIDVIEREFRPGDLAGVQLVIAATDDAETNEAVWREARAVGCLVNVVDDPPRCNFHVPAAVRRGDLTVAISTGGKSPLLACRIRQTLETHFDSSYGDYLDLLGELRTVAQEQIPNPARRRQFWSALLDSDVLALFRAGDARAACGRAEQIFATFRPKADDIQCRSCKSA